MRASNQLLDYIKGKEKFSPVEYDDGTGTMTNGYGNTEGDTSTPITEEEASRRLMNRVIVAEKELAPYIKRNLSQSQQDVLIDMHYNMGLGELLDTGLIDLVNKGDDVEVSRKILNYNKATNKKTGKVEILGGLVKRANERSQMWVTGLQPAGQVPEIVNPLATQSPTFSPASFDDQSLDTAIKAFESNNEQSMEVDDRDLDSAIKRFEMFENQPVDGGITELKLASDAADPADVLKVSEANLISKETGVPSEVVLGMMTEGYTGKEIRAKAKISDINRNFRATARWAKKGSNFAVFQETGDWAMQVEASARGIRNRPNVARAYDQGLLTMGEAATSLGLLLGTVTAEEAEERFQLLDQEKQAHAIKSTDLDAVRKEWEAYVKKGGSLWDVVAFTAERPSALGLQTIESAVTSAIPFSMSVAGMLYPPALPYATGGAFLSGGAIAYGTKFRENLEQFRDPTTGRLDIKKALADKNQVERWKKEALVYGSIMGVFDAAFGLVAGKFFPKLAKAGAKLGSAGAKAGKAAGAIAEVASGPVSEGLSEVFATSGADMYSGKLSKEKWEQNKRSGQLEGLMSIPVEGTFGPIAYGARKVTPMAKVRAQKTVEMVKDGIKAIKDTAAVSDLRSKVERFKDQYPDQARELVDEALREDGEGELTVAGSNEDADTQFKNYEKAAESDIPEINRQADKGMVYIAPSEWIKHFESKGLDPYTLFQYFGPEAHENFVNSAESDTSVGIPLADWVMFAATDPEIDLIARYEDNKYNGQEAADLMEVADEDPHFLFSQGDDLPPLPDAEEDTETPPAIPVEQQTPAQVMEEVKRSTRIIDATDAEGNAVLRPVDLVGKFKNDEEKRVFGGLKKKLQKIGKELKLEKQSVEAFADVQFMRLKHRADVTGRSIKDMYENTEIGIYNKPNAGHLGFFETNRIIGEKTKLMFNKGIENHIDVVIHEWGHSWLHELAEDFHYIKNLAPEDMTDAQREYSFAMDKAAELLGLQNIQELLNIDGNTYRKLHETFAQTTELYFLEGKYENNKVKAVMELFRGWIVRTLQYIKQMASIYPTLQLSPEVERMYEGILGTSSKIEEEVYPMFTPALFDDNFLGADAPKYREAWEMAQTEAVGETYFKAFKKPMKEREKIIREATKRITEEATRDVDALQSMQFLKIMDEQYQSYKDKKLDYDPRLSYESVLEELLGNNEADAAWLKSVLPSSIMTGKKKGGVDVREFMYQNQLTNPAVVLDLLLQTSKREQLIEERIKERIAAEFPVTKTDEEIHQIAVDEVNGKGKEKLLKLELKILADKYLEQYKNSAARLMQPPVPMNKISHEQLRVEAEFMVYDASAVKFSPDKYLRDSHRMAREVARAFKKNDIVEAFNYKRRETVAFMAYREAKYAQKELAIGSHLSKLIMKYAPSRDAVRRMDTDVLKFGHMLVTAFRKGDPLPKFSDVKLSSYSAVTQSQAQEIETLRMGLVDVMQSRVGKNISVEAGLVYTALMKKIMHVATTAKEVEIGGKKKAIKDIADEITATVPAEGPVTTYEKDWWLSASRRRVSNQKVSTALASLYNSQEEYAASSLGMVMGDIRQAEAQVSMDIAEAEARLHEAIKKVVKSGPKKTTKENIFAPLKRLSKPEKIMAPEIDFIFNSEGDMLYALAMALGSESGLYRFLTSINPMTGKPISTIDVETGELQTDKFNAFVDRLIATGKLRKEHFELFQEIWNTFEPFHGKVADVMRDTDGVQIGKIRAKKFSNQFGEWTGGYVPVAEDKGIDKVMVKAGLLQVDTNGYVVSDLYPTMSTGLTKERKKVSNAPLDLDMRKVLSYVSAASKIAHLRKPMMTFGSVMKRPEVAARIETRRPELLKNVVTPWFDYVVDQIYTDPDKHIGHTIFGKLRKNANTVMYLGGLMTPVRQFYGLLPSANRVGAKNLRASLAKMGGVQQAKQTMAFAQEKSKFMRERAQGSLRKYVKSHDTLDTNFDWWSQVNGTQDFLTYVLTQGAQNIVDTATWDAAYYNGIEVGLDEKAAIRLADSAVADTQGSPNVSDMSAIQRGTNMERLFTMVTSVPIAMNNMIAEEMMRTSDGQQKLKIATSMGILLMALPFILDAGIDLATNDEDEKTEDTLKLMAYKMSAGFLDTGFPVISRPITGWLAYDNPSVSPALSKLTNAARAPGVLKRTAQGVDISAKEMALLLETMTLVGFPLTSAGGRVMRFSDNNITSEKDKKVAQRRRRRQMRVIRRQDR